MNSGGNPPANRHGFPPRIPITDTGGNPTGLLDTSDTRRMKRSETAVGSLHKTTLNNMGKDLHTK